MPSAAAAFHNEVPSQKTGDWSGCGHVATCEIPDGLRARCGPTVETTASNIVAKVKALRLLHEWTETISLPFLQLVVLFNSP